MIGDIKDKTALIFDDEVDTAGSIMETVKVVKQFGAKDVYVGCTHGVLSGPAIERIENSALEKLVITDSIPLAAEKQIDKIEVLSMAPLFARIIDALEEGKSLSRVHQSYAKEQYRGVKKQ